MVGDRWERVRLPGGVSIAIPPEFSSDDAQGMDSPVQSWSGDRINVLIDSSPMSDHLDRCEGDEEEVSGRLARVVNFDDAGTRVFAVHLDDPALTIAIRIECSEGESVARAILKSLTISE